MEMLRDLAHKHGRAVVIVTHDPRVLEFADRIIYMEDGRIASDSNDAVDASVAGPAAQMASHRPVSSALAGIPA